MDWADVVTPAHTRPPGILHIRKNTQKSKFLLSQAFKWKKIMFFVIPEMPSKTFVMLYKKLPDHFNVARKLSMMDSQTNSLQSNKVTHNNYGSFLLCPDFSSVFLLWHITYCWCICWTAELIVYRWTKWSIEIIELSFIGWIYF